MEHLKGQGLTVTHGYSDELIINGNLNIIDPPYCDLTVLNNILREQGTALWIAFEKHDVRIDIQWEELLKHQNTKILSKGNILVNGIPFYQLK